MEAPHPLKTLLQLHLASDSYAVAHLPFILDTLSPKYFEPSSHIQKWIARVNSLIHSKDTGARWSGLCIALRTSVCSKSIMVESAPSWTTSALSLLSKNEPPPVLKASIRLLDHIFATTTDISEFQRQICIPNVPKFSLALISIVKKEGNEELQLLAMSTLSHLIPLYPSLHRPIQTQLSSLALKQLNGSAPTPTSPPVLSAASSLYTVLHLTGGKVGAANHWRKSLEDTLAFAWEALLRLRTTFPSTSSHPVPNQSLPAKEDPVIAVPLNMDRLRAAIYVICELLSSPTPRAVSLPLGSLVRLCLTLLRCTSEDDRNDGHIDLTTRSLEISIVPELWNLGSSLAESLSRTARQHLTPHVPQLAFSLAYRLEQQQILSQRLPHLRAITALFTYCHHFYDTIISSRLLRAILPSLTIVLAPQSTVKAGNEQSTSYMPGKRSKRKTRGFEGDEVFKVTREIVCQTDGDGLVLIAALDAVRTILCKAQVAPAMQSITSRILLSILMSLPLMPPTLLSADVSLHGIFYGRVQEICVQLASGTTSSSSKSLGLVVHAMHHDTDLMWNTNMQHEIDLLLHPRLPPIVRSLPHIEALSLFPAEENQEELDARRSLGLLVASPSSSSLVAPSQSADVPSPAPVPHAPMAVDTATSRTETTHSHAIARTETSDNLPGGASSTFTKIAAVEPISGNLQPAAVPSSSSIQPPSLQQWSAKTRTDVPSTSVNPLSSDPLPPSTAAKPFGSGAPSVPAPEQVALGVQASEENEDEPMPSINMESDSDSD